MISSIFSFFHLIFMNNYPASAIYKKIIFFSEKHLHFHFKCAIILFVVMVCADDCIPIIQKTSCAHKKEVRCNGKVSVLRQADRIRYKGFPLSQKN